MLLIENGEIMAYNYYNVSNNIECDTDKLIESSDNILNLMTEYEKKINEMFKRLNFSTDKDAWIGDNALLYAKIAMQDKQDYLDFGENIKCIARYMKEFAADLDEQIKENEDICASAEDSSVGYY